MKITIPLLSAFALVASGCSVTTPTNAAGGHCTTNSDCTGVLQCLANVCTASDNGSASGGSNGTADGTADGTATSGASSAGAGSSSSAGSGSTGGAMMRLINARQHRRARDDSAIDACVKGPSDSDFASAGFNVAIGGHASDFVAIATGSVTVRVVAHGAADGCATKLDGVADQIIIAAAALALFSGRVRN